jgi:hypothetical protein
MSLADLGIVLNPHGRVERRAPCPQCNRGPRDDALGVNVETGAFHCFRCGWKGRAGGSSTEPQRVVRLDDPAVIERKRERLCTTWRETVPLTHPRAHAVRAYLKARALGDVLRSPPVVLRAHPGLEYWDGPCSLGRFAAMVAMFHGAAGEPVTLHVTYLSGSAKAPVPSPKKILGVPRAGATKGGAIRLYAPRAGVLGISEGIESALSLGLMARIPVWASFCADNLARAHLPAGLRDLRIGVDVDPSGKGRAVAEALAARVRKWSPRTRVRLMLPDDGLDDLNSELMRRAASR